MNGLEEAQRQFGENFFFFFNKMDLEAVQKYFLLRRIALVVPPKLSTNSNDTHAAIFLP